jgi:hypothetical protein
VARRREWTGRTQRALPRWPAGICWFLGLTLGGAGLVGLAYLVGHGEPRLHRTVLEDIGLTISKPAVALGIGFLVAIEAAWCYRQLALEYLARKPGRIEVAPFTTTADLSAAHLDQLTLTFRRRLSEMRLQAPSGVPGAVPEGDVLDVLGRGGIDPRNPLGSLLTVLRAARPTRAYQVNGVLLKGGGQNGFGATVQVVRLPDRARVPVTVWDASWEAVIQRAADSATAAILPLTKLCRDQWVTWRRLVMPEGLLHSYEEGARLEQERRYDEALKAYFDALEQDPMNLVLRLQIGKLQEKLGLYLDAFSTYEGIRAVSSPGGEDLPRRLYRLAARRQRKRTVWVANYRRLVLMGGADLAKQWRTTAASGRTITLRDRRRDALRARLRTKLSKELKRAAKRHADSRGLLLLRKSRRGDHAIGDLLRVGGDESPDDARRSYLELRELLALAALDAVRLLRLRVFFARRAPVGPSAVALTRLCIEERLAWIQHRLAVEAARDEPTQGGDSVTEPPWPPTADALEKRIDRIERREFRSWHEHYNAACAFAVPLLDHKVPAELQRDLARRAVDRLERATARADGAFVAAQRDWLLAEDPDLSGLRTQASFKQFDAMYFPSASAVPERPREVHTLENSRYVQALLATTAAHWQTEWRRRGRSLERRPDVQRLLCWWEDEREAWRLVRRVAVHYRHWEARLRLVEHVARCGARYPIEPLAVPFPNYIDRPLPNADDETCEEEIRLADLRLDTLAGQLSKLQRAGNARAMLRELEAWQARLQNLDLSGDQPRRYFLAKVCDCHAGLWQLLKQWFAPTASWQSPEERLALDREAAEAFFAHMGDASRMWATAYDWWSAGGLIAAISSPQAWTGGVAPWRVLRWSAGDWWADRWTRTPPNGTIGDHELGPGARASSR